MNLSRRINSLIDRPTQQPELAFVEQMAAEYPFFTLPVAILLKRGAVGLDDDIRRRMLASLALNASNRDVLFRLLDRDGEEFARFYPAPPASPQVSTDRAIDTFLENYGSIDPREEALLEKLIFHPVPDYSAVLKAEEQPIPSSHSKAPEPDSQDAMLDAFLEKSGVIEPSGSAGPSVAASATADRYNPDPDSLLSESLAKIYIKQRRYDKAYEIIRNLSLNFPEKSIYFADQLRFLQKLILNNQYSKPKTTKNITK